jgi:hypothetical protein
MGSSRELLRFLATVTMGLEGFENLDERVLLPRSLLCSS